MDKQDFMNCIYDLIAQNPIAGCYGMKGGEHDFITSMVEHVDTERMAIVFKSAKGREFELQLVDTWADNNASKEY